KSRPKAAFKKDAEGPDTSSRETRSAAAGAGSVRILDHELRTLEVFLVIDLGADEILVAHRVDQQGHAVLGHRRVVFVRDFVEGKSVLEARAPAALHKYAQLEVGIAFFGDQIGDLGCRTVGE